MNSLSPPPLGGDGGNEQVKRQRAGELQGTVNHGRERRYIRLRDIGGREGDQREAEQQQIVGPDEARRHMTRRDQQIVVIDPVDRDKDEAEQIDRERRSQLDERSRFCTLRRLQVEHMIVIMTAMTPSEKASRRALEKRPSLSAIASVHAAGGGKEKSRPGRNGSSIVAPTLIRKGLRVLAYSERYARNSFAGTITQALSIPRG